MSWVQQEEEKVEKKYRWVKKIRAFFHFIFLTSIIFIVLLLVSNWSAYSAFARSMIAPEALQKEQAAIEGSIAQAEVVDSTEIEEIKKARIQKILKRQLEK